MKTNELLRDARGKKYHIAEGRASLLLQAGLEIESLSRWHFGTTYVIVARPAAA